MLKRGPFWEKVAFAEDVGGDGSSGLGELVFEDAPAGRGIALEVVEEEPAELAGKDRAALLKELQEKEEAFKKEKAALEAQASPVAALQTSFAGLAERLEKAQRLPQQPPQQPQFVPQRPFETPEQFEERIRTTFLEAPIRAIAEVGERLYGPALAQQAASIASLSKQLLMQQPEKKIIFERYGAEIEALAATAPGNPNAIFEATEIIAARHQSELVTEQAKALAQKMFEEMQGKGAGTGQSQVPRSAPFVEGAAPKAPTRNALGQKVLRVTPTQRATIAAEAAKRHMTEEQYVELYVDNDWQKEFK